VRSSLCTRIIYANMAKSKEYNIEIKNKRASFEYRFIELFEAGILLQGTEIKSIRQGKANLSDAYCYFKKGELYVRSMFIAEYDHGNYANHDARRPRKLLLKRQELKKLEKRAKERGLTIVPTRLYVNERGLAKLEIALAQGKKVYDKRESIKRKDLKREMDRLKRIR